MDEHCSPHQQLKTESERNRLFFTIIILCEYNNMKKKSDIS